MRRAHVDNWKTNPEITNCMACYVRARSAGLTECALAGREPGWQPMTTDPQRPRAIIVILPRSKEAH
jgi:hypothetical protein